MFYLLYVVARLYRALKWVISVPLSFCLLGTPVLWALIQRRRIKALAPKMGWTVKPSEQLKEIGTLTKSFDAIEVMVTPDGSFGTTVFAYFTTQKQIELEQRRPRTRSRKKLQDFKSSDSRFNSMFGTMRGRSREVEALARHPEVLAAVVALRRRWMFRASDLEVTRNYLLMYMDYGTPLAYYLPPRLLDRVAADAAAVTARLDQALGTQGPPAIH